MSADLTELFCTAKRCPVIIGNTLAYFDRKHTTMEYARLWHRYSVRWLTARSFAVDIPRTDGDANSGGPLIDMDARVIGINTASEGASASRRQHTAG